ncbi:cadmium resistance transporter [Methylobacterium sp. 17Sr1-1]|uniref:cadmium resistance transporter n=1 Tax=Methylobacterium sp. 17Sr1-1 TaxID=2202826 RepID=UPI000D6EF1A7|nr:cadmium resistance transporter [Methylobacterium sp. 17Sr1-1]AWN54091.1 quaternary ammonium transporter [Methylobacterium sp. 17Sr1-1]
MPLLTDLGVALVLFASTNLDDIVVLIGFFSDPRYRPGQIVVGQGLGIAALVLAALAGALLSLAVPPAWLGLLGLVPIGLGCRRLVTLRDEAEDEPARGAASLGNTLAVAGVTIANGGDNLGIYTPVFATAPTSRLILFVAVFAVMTALWLALARGLVRHPALSAPIRRFGRVATPFVLIGIGAMVLVEAGTVSWVTGGASRG